MSALSHPDMVIAQITDELRLLVLNAGKRITATIYRGPKWPDGTVVSTTVFDSGACRVDTSDARPSLWLGDTIYHLPWLELLKVADFLRLDIPVPPTEEVPT